MRQVRSKQKFCALVLLTCFCLFLCGCPKKQKYPDDMPEPYPTVITIIQDGKPLEGASIVLASANGPNTWSASAVTDATGKASLKTLSKYDGVVPGKYHILISKRISDESKLTMPDPETDPQGYAKFMQESMREKLDTYDLIDPKFFRISADTETIEVVADKNKKNEKTIDVGTAVRMKR